MGREKKLDKTLEFPKHLKKWEWLPIGADKAVLCEDGVYRYRIYHFNKWRVYEYQTFVKHPETEKYCALETLPEEAKKNALKKVQENFQNAFDKMLI